MSTTVTILRDLWRVRAAVLVIFIGAVLIGSLMLLRISAFPPKLKSRHYEVGVATARVLVDTPTSEIIDVSPKGSDTLVGRATLIANLMVDGVVEDAIAKRAGLRSDQLVGMAGTAEADPTAPKPGPRDYTIATTVLLDRSGDQLPIITIATQAPHVDGAERLANAAIAGLTAYLDSQATSQSVPPARRLRVTGLGPAQAGIAVHGPSRLVAMVVVILVFAMGCGTLLVLRALRRDWHALSADEALGVSLDDHLAVDDGTVEYLDEWPASTATAPRTPGPGGPGWLQSASANRPAASRTAR